MGWQVKKERVMIKKRSSVMLVTIGMLGMILFNGCGAGTSGDVPAPPPGQTVAASIDLSVSTPQLNSDGATTVTLTAIVKDSSNRALSEKEVSFSADSGVLAVTSGKTGTDGTATATLGTGGNPSNRPIHLTAATGSVSAANTVTVTGTTLSISGATSLSLGASTPLTISLKNSAGAGITGRTVTVTSAKGNTLSASSLVTDLTGQVSVNVTATAGGADKITASAIGATKAFDLTVNTAILTFINPPPPAVAEVSIGTNQPVTVEYISGTTPQAGVTVNFVATRGALSSSAAVTGADGRATVTVASTNSGPALLVATIAGGPTAQIAVEFVATTVSRLELQASPAVIGTNSGGATTQQSLITAVVRDANNNLVKNRTVNFNIVNDVSGGSLSPASAITDSFGSAGTVFIAGASPGGLGGVTIRATVMGTAVTATTALTVAKKALFITLATGPTVLKVDPNKYQQDYVALVTDSAGNPVVGATVVATVTPMHYQKGYFIWPTGGVAWQQVVTLEAVSSTLPGVPACANEDGMLHNPLYDFNGLLDPGEDQNGNSRLDPGNVASVTAGVTDANGHATVSIVYARDYAFWVNVKLEAIAQTAGSTASAFVIFDLVGAASDYISQSVSPPGNPSPFGTSTSCFVDLTVTPVSSSQMAITWQKSATASFYRVFRNGINIANTTQNTYFDSGLANGALYCYQIRTVDAAGTESSFTGTVCNSTVIAAPSGLSATAISPSQIRISWTALAGATGYHLYRDGSLLPLKSVVSTSTVDSGLAASTLHCYAVSGFNAAGVESPKSAQVCATTQLTAPATPTGLTATGSEGPPATVTLAWNASFGAAVYRIYRDGGEPPAFTPSLSVAAPAVTARDTGGTAPLLARTGYCYTIAAVDASGNESAQSTSVCTATGGVAPPSPTGLSATLLAGPQVRLNWSAAPGAVVYRIYRDGVRTLSAAGPTATDTTVFANNVYCYTVSAEDGLGNESAKSAAVCIATSGAPPLAPTDLSALVGVLAPGPPATFRVDLTWTASSGAVVYRIYRDGALILSATGPTVTDTTVAANQTYCYAISAQDYFGNESGRSVSVCVTTAAAPPPTPTLLTAVGGTSGFLTYFVDLTWSASPGAVLYRIYRGGVFRLQAIGLAATDTSLSGSTVYCYRVSAVDGLGIESPQSPQVCTATPP
jgi:fibronectin type 3 domain-containing protein